VFLHTKIAVESEKTRIGTDRGSGRCCQGVGLRVRGFGSTPTYRVREISTDVVMTSMKLGPSLANALMNKWKHRLGPSGRIREHFLQWDIENTAVEGQHKGALWICVCHFHALLR
jgi:hypothetical protein